MKKLIFFFTFCSLIYANAQNSAWELRPVSPDVSEPTKLGTMNQRAISFVVHDTVRMILDSASNTLRFPQFETTEENSSQRLLMMDNYGNIFPQGRVPGYSGPLPSKPCDHRSLPWFWGGNLTNSDNNKLGTCTNHDFVLMTNNTPRMFFDKAGWVTIGKNITAPSGQNALLELVGDSAGGYLWFDAVNDWGSISTINNLSLNTNKSLNMNFGSGHNYSIAQNGSAKFNIANGGNIDIPGKLSIGTTAASSKLTIDAGTSDGVESRTNGTTTKSYRVYNTSNSVETFAVHGNGKTNIGYQVGAGNSAFLNLNVDGGTSSVNAFDVFDKRNNKVNFRIKSDGLVYARELNIRLDNFPDYVFKNDYKLRSIESLEKYIVQHKHLPNVPSALEVKESGANLGELSRIQMEKTEELTLYVIEIYKEIQSLKKENEVLKSEMAKMISNKKN